MPGSSLNRALLLFHTGITTDALLILEIADWLNYPRERQRGAKSLHLLLFSGSLATCGSFFL